MIHAGETYLAMRLDALALAMSEAQVAIGQNDNRNMIGWLREVRNQSADVLSMLDAEA